MDRLRDTGVFGMEIPRELGGAEATPGEILRAIETVAAADASTGWCVMIGIANNGVSGFMPTGGAREVFADPSAPTAGVFAPTAGAVRVDGGLRVSGRWQFASGITHADWVWAGCIVMEGGQPRMTPMGPEIVYAAMPVADVTVHDTWFTTGLCATGSNDLSAADLFVPDRRTFSFMDPTQHRREPIFRLPPMGWFVSHLAAVSLGVGRGALDELIDLAQRKVPTFSMAVLADRPAAQLAVARADASLCAARAFLFETVDELWRAVQAGDAPTLRQRALNRAAANNAAEAGAAAARTARELTGGSSVFAAGSAQRHVRDAEAITAHFSVSAHVWEDVGRSLMGRQPGAPMF